VKVANTPKSVSGEATFTTLVDPADTPNLPKSQSFQWARAQGPLNMPVYPPNALESKVGPVTVAVRIVIDVDGKVAAIIDSPFKLSSTGPFAAEFRASAEEAIRSWSFEPGEIQTLEDGKDLDGDGKPDYQIIISRQRVRTHVDIVFDFKITERDGQVSTSVTTSSSKEEKGTTRGKSEGQKNKTNN
jgi:hypothetical protein